LDVSFDVDVLIAGSAVTAVVLDRLGNGKIYFLSVQLL
jgi:hypothetical protein